MITPGLSSGTEGETDGHYSPTNQTVLSQRLKKR